MSTKGSFFYEPGGTHIYEDFARSTEGLFLDRTVYKSEGEDNVDSYGSTHDVTLFLTKEQCQSIAKYVAMKKW